MANEFERINNPDSTPGAVSTGYQLQNTGFIAQRVGLDCSVVLGGTGQCTLEISGPVDVNGEIYTCNAQVVFPLVTAGKYYIHLAGTGANLTPTIGTGANTFDADKNARYTDTGAYRVLNWVIYYDGTTAYVDRLVHPVNSDVTLYDASVVIADITTANITTANVTNPISPKTQITNILVQTGISENDLFLALSTYIPNTNDKMILNGAVFSTNLFVCAYAIRNSSTRIRLYIISDVGTTGDIVLDSGQVNTYNVALSW